MKSINILAFLMAISSVHTKFVSKGEPSTACMTAKVTAIGKCEKQKAKEWNCPEKDEFKCKTSDDKKHGVYCCMIYDTHQCSKTDLKNVKGCDHKFLDSEALVIDKKVTDLNKFCRDYSYRSDSCKKLKESLSTGPVDDKPADGSAPATPPTEPPAVPPAEGGELESMTNFGVLIAQNSWILSFMASVFTVLHLF